MAASWCDRRARSKEMLGTEVAFVLVKEFHRGLRASAGEDGDGIPGDPSGTGFRKTASTRRDGIEQNLRNAT